jgi:DNA-binding NarL/FixJ family response regulator
MTANGNRAVTVLVVDDHRPLRSVMGELVTATPGFALVGEAASGEAALASVAERSPQMVIMDKRMPGMDGIQATRLLTERHPQVVVVLVTVEELDTEARYACGAAAFVPKHRLSPRLLREVWREYGT